MSKQDTVVTIEESIPKRILVTEKEVPSDGSSTRPRLGRRRTTDGFGNDVESDHLNPIASFFSRLMENDIARYAIYIIPVASILAIPVALFSTVSLHVTLDGHTPALGMCIWIESCWAFLWISKILATIIPAVFGFICSLVKPGLRKYTLILEAVTTPLTIFIWTILCMASYPEVYAFNKHYHQLHQAHTK